MGRESELARLEEYVERLLSGYSDLKRENQRLEQELNQQRHENERLRQGLDSLDVERGDVYERVNSLIEKIEHWESATGDSAGALAKEDAGDKALEHHSEKQVPVADQQERTGNEEVQREEGPEESAGRQASLFST